MNKVSVVTWNVWFGGWRQRARWKALWQELETIQPDVVCLQEVVTELLTSRELQTLRQRGYWISEEGPSAYDTLIVSRLPVRASERMELPSGMGRNLLIAELEGGPTIATVHLESTSPMQAFRVEQLKLIVERLSNDSDVVFLGDMNFDAEPSRKGAKETAVLKGYRDVWSELHPADPGYTIDAEVNEMRMVQKSTKQDRKRIDRVFIKTKAFRPIHIQRLGMQPLPDDPLTFISDHFGLHVILERDDVA